MMSEARVAKATAAANKATRQLRENDRVSLLVDTANPKRAYIAELYTR